MMSFDVFGHEDKVGTLDRVFGGGAIGVELAIHLNGLGHESTIVEMAEYIAAKAQLTERTDYLTWLDKTGVKTMVNTTCTEITDKGARVKNADGEQFLGRRHRDHRRGHQASGKGTRSVQGCRVRRHQRGRLRVCLQHRPCHAYRLRRRPHPLISDFSR